jgi:hypothetical protein
MLPEGGWRLKGRNTLKEGFRGFSVSEVIDKAVPRLSPPLLVDEVFRVHLLVPPQNET